MAKGSIKGIDQVVKELRAISKDVEKEIDAITYNTALQIEGDAKRIAPVNFGKLRQSIYTTKIKDSNYKITANESYAPYVEFGTGGLVNVPAGWEALASQFIGKGIKQINIHAQPFMYPAFTKGKKDYLDNLKKLLSKYNKKI
jgi:HK97 gp10 family phage protein